MVHVVAQEVFMLTVQPVMKILTKLHFRLDEDEIYGCPIFKLVAVIQLT